jgi:hypothetical protein
MRKNGSREEGVWRKTNKMEAWFLAATRDVFWMRLTCCFHSYAEAREKSETGRYFKRL